MKFFVALVATVFAVECEVCVPAPTTIAAPAATTAAPAATTVAPAGTQAAGTNAASTSRRLALFEEEEEDDIDLPVRNLASHEEKCTCPAGQVEGTTTTTTTEAPAAADNAAIASVLAASALAVSML